MNIPFPNCSGEANTPCSIMISEIIGSTKSRQILRVLFDLWLNQSLIHKRVLTETACIKISKNLNQTTTLGGTMQLNQMVTLEQLCFPEFNKNIKIEWHEMVKFNSSCWYDIILGGDFLQKAGINIKMNTKSTFKFGIKLITYIQKCFARSR